MGRYRRLDVFLVGIGVTMVWSLVFWTGLGRGWLVWLAPLVGGAVAGGLVGEWRKGSGAGGYTAGIGGFLFVVANNWHLGTGAALSRGLFTFAMFALLGLVCGGVAGFVTGRFRYRESGGNPEGPPAEEGEPAESPASEPDE